jgi:hypothetical protein
MVRQYSQAPELPALDDGVLKRMYIEYDTPCDALVSDPTRLLSFAQDYGERTGQRVKPVQVSHCLLTPCKLGEARGGLQKLRREFNARNLLSAGPYNLHDHYCMRRLVI